MKKIVALSLMLVVLSASLFAQGGSEESAAKEDDGVVKVALIVENTIDDKGWCQAMHDGILAAQERMPGEIEYSYSEKMKPVDAGSAARQYVADGYDIIIGHGAQYKNLILEMADEYPDVTFAFGTSAEVGPENVVTYMPESEETGYLSGIIAATISKVDVLGVVGPVDGGDAARYNRGFVLGAKSVKPDVEVMVAHTGSFSDYIKAGEVAQSQIKAGVDVLTGSSQQALGALRATADYPDEDIWWVGQDLAQLKMAEGQLKCVAASSYDYAPVIVSLVENVKNGVKGGYCVPMNFANGGFIFGFNEALSDLYGSDLEDAINAQISEFVNNPNSVDWKSVDYSQL
ncbi:MAG: BMP family protein [Sphaerochaetaceae bacterium]|nr:BMP family protein [Sphaerochaetaceae bacterium]MDC7236232.1 BMP family protein [Sphaerochaetaceae bacterium]MDC7244119.1 BMP family protein [Sphaerochaetaceae bacterium]MDC7248765.1 BMP family protein [Sphaerochaetaceae bacterium]